MLQYVFERAHIPCPLQVVRDGRCAINYLKGEGEYADREKFPVPCLVLLDLKLPEIMGFAVLEWIRKQSPFKTLTVVMFSSSELPTDVNRAYDLGANSYIVKPGKLEKALELGHLIKGWWLGFNRFPPIDATPDAFEL